MATVIRRILLNIERLAALAIVCFAAPLATDGGAANAEAGVVVVPAVSVPPPPPSKFRETMEDLSVKVMGGRVSVKRVYTGFAWLPNQAWADLQLSKPTSGGFSGSVVISSGGSGGGGGGGSVGSVFLPPITTGGGGTASADANIPAHAIGVNAVIRMADVYKPQGGGVFAFQKRDVIRATDSGFRWQDRDGHSADYDKDGRILSYRDRNDVVVSFVRDSDHHIVGVVDTLGRQILTLEYTNGLISAIRDTANRSVSYRYTGTRMTTYVDARGNSWQYEYTSNGTPSSRTDPEGRKMTLTGCYGWVWETKDQDGAGATYKCTFDKAKKQFYIQAKTAGGLVAEAWYDENGLGVRRDINGKTIFSLSFDGRTRTSTDRNGGRTVNVYDEWDNLLSRTYADGSSLSNTYDPVFSNVIRAVDENGVVTNNEYDAKGNLTRKTEALGRPEQRVTVYTYDVYGNRTSAKRLADDRTIESAYSATYDDSGNIVTFVSPEGQTSRYTYDVMGNVLTITDPRGKVWTYTYDTNGLLLTAADPLGNVGGYEYNKVGDKTKATDPNGKSWLFAYDRQHRLIRTTDPLGKSTTYEYSLDGLVTKYSDQENKVRTYQYDLGMRLFKVVDGDGNVTTQTFADDGVVGSGSYFDAVKVNWPTFEEQFKYDRRNRITLNTALLGAEGFNTGFAYDPKGNVVKATDANGKSWLFEYDAFDNVTKETDTLGNVTQYEYDNRNNVIRIVDPNNHANRFEYDRQNRLLKEIRALGQTTQYVYDANGNAIDRIDPKGQKTHHVYDDAGRLIERTYFAAGSATALQTIGFSYDANGNTIAWNDGTFSGTYTYDDVQRKTGETVNYGAFTLNDSYGYFGNNALSSFTGPDGVAYAYTYDGENLFTGVQLPTGALTVNEYFWTEPKKVTLPGGTTQMYGYNGLLNLQSLQVKGPTQNPLFNLNNAYNRVQSVEQKSLDTGTINYSYDDNQWLIGAQSSAGTQNYTLDGLGNRIADGTGAWSYDANNQLVNRPGATYEYDDNGNLARKTAGGAVTNYFYDVANRLIRVEDQSGAVIARYGYNPFDQRLFKEVGGVRTYFFHSDLGMVAEIDTSGAPIRSYGYHPVSGFGTVPLFVKEGANYAFYHLDHLGTPMALTDATGRIVWSADYDAFGRATLRIADVTSHLRYPGQYFDAETGLHYNDRRYYDPDVGRYLTEDPLGVDGGLNLYLYSDADPINLADPTGECWIAGAVGGAVSGAIWSVVGQLFSKGCFKAISWKDVAIDAAIGAAEGALTCGLSKLMNRVPKCPGNSFAGTTLVHTRTGLVPIQDVQVGDEVLTYAEWSNEQSYQKVEAVIAHAESESITVVSLDDATTIEATDGHPFYLIDQGWTDASRLAVGDRVRLRDGGQARVVALEQKIKYGKYVNLTVANTHTFYIGDDGTLVHNGSLYVVPGCRTPSGKPYVGRTKHDNPKLRGRSDGRNRLPGDKVGSYPSNDVQAGREAEQKLIDKYGLGNLDNKRNEIRKK